MCGRRGSDLGTAFRYLPERSFTPDLYVNLGNGQGAFTTSTVRTYGNSEYWGIAVADFNGNGNVGLIATRGNYLDFYTAAGNYEIIFSIDYEDDPLYYLWVSVPRR